MAKTAEFHGELKGVEREIYKKENLPTTRTAAFVELLCLQVKNMPLGPWYLPKQ